jgi:hypothetical protein
MGRNKMEEYYFNQIRDMDIKMLSFFTQAEVERRKKALESALNGDWVPLGDYFEDGITLAGKGRLTPEIRAFIVDVMYGRRQQPRRKSGPTRKEKRDREIAKRVLALRMNGEKRAVEKIAEEFGLEQRQAWRAFKEYGDITAAVEKSIDNFKSAIQNVIRCIEAEWDAPPPPWAPGRYPARSTTERFCSPNDIKS